MQQSCQPGNDTVWRDARQRLGGLLVKEEGPERCRRHEQTSLVLKAGPVWLPARRDIEAEAVVVGVMYFLIKLVEAETRRV